MEIQESVYVIKQSYEFSSDVFELDILKSLTENVIKKIYNLSSLTRINYSDNPLYTGQIFALNNKNDSEKHVLVGFICETYSRGEGVDYKLTYYNPYFIVFNVEPNTSNIIGYNAYKITIDSNYIFSSSITAHGLEIICGNKILFGYYDSEDKDIFTLPPKGIFLECNHCNVVPQEYIGEISTIHCNIWHYR